MICLACKGAQNHALSHTVKNQLMLSKMPLLGASSGRQGIRLSLHL